jgi:murein DD-endopeptidase MepM/ murein hydrolase activator NlpD
MCGRQGGLAPFESFPQTEKSYSITHRFTDDGYIVKKGDTLYSIAKMHNIPLNDLIQKNRLSPPFKLSLGQHLIFPRAHHHTVQKGDTLYSIASRYSMDQYTLSHLNNLKYPYTLSIGQVLRISTSASPINQKKRPHKKIRITSSASLPAREGKFVYPVYGRIISRYGIKKDGSFNDGINISAPAGSVVKAAESGLVVYTGKSIQSFGNLVLIKHREGWVTAYAHLKNFSVKEGTQIKRSQVLGTVGQSGFVKKPQLHFEIRKGTKTYDPQKYL